MCLFVLLVNETQCSYTEKWCRIYFQKLFTKELLENFTKNYKEMAINTFEVGLKLYFLVTYYNTVYLHKKKIIITSCQNAHLAIFSLASFCRLSNGPHYAFQSALLGCTKVAQQDDYDAPRVTQIIKPLTCSFYSNLFGP